jgi:hypothetical protein
LVSAEEVPTFKKCLKEIKVEGEKFEIDWDKIRRYESIYKKNYSRIKRILNHEYREVLLNKAENEA